MPLISVGVREGGRDFLWCHLSCKCGDVIKDPRVDLKKISRLVYRLPEGRSLTGSYSPGTQMVSKNIH